MNVFQKYAIIAIALLAMGIGSTAGFAKDAPKAADNNVVDTGWTVRCNEQKPEQVKAGEKKACEAFNRLEVQASHMRIAEIALGYSPAKKGEVNGVIILPLGIQLPTGATMKVDDGKPLAFNSRFCTAGGCYSFITVDKDLLDSMKKGKALTIMFKTANGQDANIIMKLKSFEKAFNSIQQ